MKIVALLLFSLEAAGNQPSEAELRNYASSWAPRGREVEIIASDRARVPLAAYWQKGEIKSGDWQREPYVEIGLDSAIAQLDFYLNGNLLYRRSGPVGQDPTQLSAFADSGEELTEEELSTRQDLLSQAIEKATIKGRGRSWRGSYLVSDFDRARGLVIRPNLGGRRAAIDYCFTFSGKTYACSQKKANLKRSGKQAIFRSNFKPLLGSRCGQYAYPGPLIKGARAKQFYVKVRAQCI